MKTPKRSKNSALSACALMLAAWTNPGLAQSVASPPTGSAAANTGAAGDPAIVLSPFEVNAAEDRGYQAGNTTSGSRLNTKLKDTPAAISSFTPEFLSDIAANDLTEALQYAINVEPEFEDSNSGFQAPSSRNSDNSRTPFRIRGIAGSVAIDLIESAAPQDNYNTERLEISSGPNAVLFGLGSAGGLVSTATKRANLVRNKYAVKAQLGSWKAQRYEVDLNQRLIPQKLALRLAGVYGDREGWRYWDFEDTKRWTGAVTYRPWKNTTLAVSYEDGDFRRHNNIKWNAGDQLRLWRESGAPLRDNANLPTGVAGIGGNQRVTVIENDGSVYNMRNKMRSIGYANGPIPGPTLVPPSVMPYDYSWAGPGGYFSQDFTNYKVTAEQRINRDLVIEAVYLHTDSLAHSNNWFQEGNSIALRGDPNVTLPSITGGAAVPNPYAGKLYMETNWRPESTEFANDVFRLTGAYDLNLEKWGQHRFALLGEVGQVERERRVSVETWVDQAGVPFGNANPENANNFVWRRNNLTESDFRTYYMGDPRNPVPSFTTGGRTYSMRRVAFSAPGNADSRKLTDSGMFAMQNYWWNRRLVTTFGYRVDLITFKEGVTERLAAGSPLVTSGQKLVNEWHPTGRYERHRYRTTTETEGAVFHLNDRFSIFYNQSTNVGPPRFDRQILSARGTVVPPLTTGKGKDYVLMIDLTKDGRYFARLNYFDTRFMRDAAVSQTNYFNAGTADTEGTNEILDGLLAARLITQAEYDTWFLNNFAALVDVVSKGAEVELVANPTKNWTVRLGYSYSDRERANYFVEREPFWTDFKAFVTSRATPAARSAGGSSIGHVVADIEQKILEYIEEHGQGYAARPHKATMTTRYSFSEGRFKGLFVGGGFRYQSRNFMQEDVRVGEPTYGKKYYGEPIYYADWFIGYGLKTPWMKSKIQLQLNARNAFNWSVVGKGRYNEDFTGLRRVYLQDPRNFRFTASTEF